MYVWEEVSGIGDFIQDQDSDEVCTLPLTTVYTHVGGTCSQVTRVCLIFFVQLVV